MQVIKERLKFGSGVLSLIIAVGVIWHEFAKYGPEPTLDSFVMGFLISVWGWSMVWAALYFPARWLIYWIEREIADEN